MKTHSHKRIFCWVSLSFAILAVAVWAIVKTPAHHEATGFYYGNLELDPFFAKLPPRERTEAEAEWPSIPGIERASCLEFCPEDTCYCQRLVLLIGSPDERPLLEWVNEYVFRYLDDIGYKMPHKFVNPKSAKQIADFYVEQMRNLIHEERCRHDVNESDAITEQNALFVGTTMLDDEVCTFMTHSWYDQMSCGDNTRRSWFSIIRETGRELKLEDFISDERKDAFFDLLLATLRNNDFFWADLFDSPKAINRDSLLREMGGCALVNEGLVVYYYPYSIGCGADGQFTALIPYKDLKTVIKKDCPVKDWILNMSGE